MAEGQGGKKRRRIKVVVRPVPRKKGTVSTAPLPQLHFRCDERSNCGVIMEKSVGSAVFRTQGGQATFRWQG